MNRLFVISGPSGCGKTSIMKEIMDNEVVSFTTRPIRLHQNEIDGIDYHFFSKEKFHQLLENGGIAEWNEYAGNFYGITKEEIDRKVAKGNAFSVVDYNGMKRLKELYPDAISIFIYTSPKEASLQMSKRGESTETIANRLEMFEKEVSTKKHYDFVVRNKHGKFDEVTSIVKKIIEMES